MKPKILIVDDEYDICDLCSHFLSRKGYQVFTACDGREALLKTTIERPDLILLDIRMPDMDGLECLRKIKEIHKEALVIMVTAVSDIDMANKAMELGAIEYLTKPVGYDILEAIISTNLFLKSV